MINIPDMTMSEVDEKGECSLTLHNLTPEERQEKRKYFESLGLRCTDVQLGITRVFDGTIRRSEQ